MTISWILGYSGKTYRFFWTYNLRSMCRWVSGLYGLSHSSKFAKHYFSIAYFILDAFSRNWPVRSRKILKFTSRFKKNFNYLNEWVFHLKGLDYALKFANEDSKLEIQKILSIFFRKMNLLHWLILMALSQKTTNLDAMNGSDDFVHVSQLFKEIGFTEW